jgi:polysaccharide export outer membrane protein
MVRRARTWLLILVAAGMSCGGRPRTPAQPGDDSDFAPPERVELAGVDEDPPQALRLLPGDVVTLQAVSAETTDFAGLVVDERGQLHVPLVGDVEVGGQSLTEAEQRVETALRRFDRVVRVNLFVTEPTGHRATVVGAVTTPGVVPVPPGMRLAELFAAAGGARTLDPGTAVEGATAADLDAARLVRGGEVLPVSLTAALRGETRHNIRIRAGDHLYVPPIRGRRISVLGEVESPTVVPYQPGIRITEALAMAGGVNRDGRQSDIRVIRGDLRSPRVYTTDLNALVDGEAHNVELAPGDVIFVTRQAIASVGEVLGHLAPLLSAGTTIGVTTAVITSGQ